MSVVDMAQEDGKCGQQCAASSCGSQVHPDSKFCVAHQESDSRLGSVNKSSITKTTDRMTHFSGGRRVFARRSQPPSLRSRNSIKVQTTPSPSPREAPKEFRIPDLPSKDGRIQSGSRAEPSAPETNAQPDNSKLHDHVGQGSVPSHDSKRCIVPEANRKVTSLNPSRPGADSFTKTPDQSLLSPEYGKEDVPGATQSPEITSPNLDCSGGPRDRQGPKECYLVDKAQASTKPQPSASMPTSPNHAQAISKAHRPPPHTHVHSPLSNSSQASLDSGGAADIESNVDEEPPAPADAEERNFDSIDQHDTTSTLENSLEPEFDKARTPQIGEESNESVPMSSATSITPEKPQTSHVQVNSDGSSLRSEDTLVMREVITPPRRKMEARKERMLANFNSDAFDALIYQQSNLPPPRGVKFPTRSPKKRIAPYQDDRLALHTNPAIHGMHRRSKDWYQKKSREIEDRGGRKAWFGKVAERQRYLRAKDAAIEQECREAELAGRIPPRQDPQPRGHKRIQDFGDVPEEELPEIVRNNPAWLKACAWHRQTRRRTQAGSPPPSSKPSLPEPPQPKQTPELDRHMQKAAEEARRFYQEAVKELQPCGGMYGWRP